MRALRSSNKISFFVRIVRFESRPQLNHLSFIQTIKALFLLSVFTHSHVLSIFSILYFYMEKVVVNCSGKMGYLVTELQLEGKVFMNCN